jgi:hypothetical protein
MQSLKIVAACVVAAILYGIAHDQVTARICVEYFTVFHPPVFHTGSPTLLALGWGVIATWWMGALLGIPLAVAARAGSRPKLSVRDLARPIGILLLAMSLIALASGLAGFFWGRLDQSVAALLPQAIHRRFLADSWAHAASYASGFLGGIALCGVAYRKRALLSIQAGHEDEAALRIPAWAKAGMILVSVGLATIAARYAWSSTRTWFPVGMPIAMRVGHVRTPEFEVNLDALYNIYVVVQKETLNCLLGVEDIHPERCKDVRPVLKASWTVRSGSVVVARGSSDENRGGGWFEEGIDRDIGSFRAKGGRRYMLEVDILVDGTLLDAGNPRLMVGVDPEYYEGYMITTLFFVTVPAIGCMLVGVVLILVGFARRPNRPGRRDAT